ncbi:hypothetical protein MASR2M39_32300 [Ignavibacteriales bacterium]
MDLTEQTPSQLAELRLKLSDDYSKAGELKVRMMRARAEYYQDHRDDVKSDAALERLWETTNEGLNLMELREKMRSIEHKLSAIRTLLEVRNNEAKNMY